MKHKSKGIISKISGYVQPYKNEDDIFCEYISVSCKEVKKLDPKRRCIDSELKLFEYTRN